MNSRISRREALQFAGGSALGLLLSPLPWKLLDDSAIWTQNWPWIAEPGRGPVTNVLTSCSLCPAGCGLRARCIAGRPVSLHGIKGHSVNNGVLCPVGLLAHHLPYHPARISQPVKLSAGDSPSNARTLSNDEALNSIADLLKSGSPALVIDSRPGRAASTQLQLLARSLRNATYIPEWTERERTQQAMADCFEGNIRFTFDLSAARTILSFRAPLIDGWHSPNRAARIFDRRRTNDNPLSILQIESTPSRTIQFADQRVMVRPGTESLFAFAIARVIIDERLIPLHIRQSIRDLPEFQKALVSFTPQSVSSQCGITADEIHAIARRFVANGPSIAVADGHPDLDGTSTQLHAAVSILNLLVGAHRPASTTTCQASDASYPNAKIEDVADGSIRVIVMDESLSGSNFSETLLAKKLAPDGILVTLSPYIVPRSAISQLIIPAHAFGEILTDVPGINDNGKRTLSIALPIMPAKSTAMSTAAFCDALLRIVSPSARGVASPEELLRQRIALIINKQQGSAFNAAENSTVPVASLGSPDDLWTILTTGGTWTDEPRQTRVPGSIRLLRSNAAAIASAAQARDLSVVQLAQNENSERLELVPSIDPFMQGTSVISPLISKLHSESGLRPFAMEVYVHPETASSRGLADRAVAALESNLGRIEVSVRIDTSVARGLVIAPRSSNDPSALSQFTSSTTSVKLSKV